MPKQVPNLVAGIYIYPRVLYVQYMHQLTQVLDLNSDLFYICILNIMCVCFCFKTLPPSLPPAGVLSLSRPLPHLIPLSRPLHSDAGALGCTILPSSLFRSEGRGGGEGQPPGVGVRLLTPSAVLYLPYPRPVHVLQIWYNVSHTRQGNGYMYIHNIHP